MSEDALRMFEDASVIITGAASGIGRAVAEELGRKGAYVVAADLQNDLVREVISNIKDSGGKGEAVELDVADYEKIKNLVERIVKETGRLDYIFNNAGIGIGGEVKDHEIEDWNRIIDVNFKGVVHGVQAAYPIMVKQGYGHIVNTASIAGLAPGPMAAAYTATKHAVVGLSASLRAEAAAYGVRVSTVCPGVIRTAILDGGKYGKIIGGPSRERILGMWERLHPISADTFARKLLKKIRKNRPVIIIPWIWKLACYVGDLMPGFQRLILRQAVKDFRKEVTKSKEDEKKGSITGDIPHE